MKNNNDFFGIEGYNMPRLEYPAYNGKHNMFAKDKGKSFADIAAGYTKVVPGPGQYELKLKWGDGDKKAPAYITKKNTYIDQIVKNEAGKPSPANVSYK